MAAGGDAWGVYWGRGANGEALTLRFLVASLLILARIALAVLGSRRAPEGD